MQSVYQDLANGIVLQAVTGSYNLTPRKIIKDLEKFFRSDYFRMLTKVNGEYLIEKLRNEHLENERRNNERNTNTSNTEPYRNHC